MHRVTLGEDEQGGGEGGEARWFGHEGAGREKGGGTGGDTEGSTPPQDVPMQHS